MGGGDRERGLTEAEAGERAAAGLSNVLPSAPSRTVGQILRANLLTPFNLLLGGLLAVILVVGPLQDALFGLVLVANAAVGIVQELRAKRTLDRLSLLSAPRARVVRDGVAREVPVSEVVQDDVLAVEPGDQVVVDGEVVASRGLEVDESLLTGESDPVAKAEGAEVLSGSFVAAGSGRFRAIRVGSSAYAAELAEEARAFTLVRSELRAGIDRIVVLVAWTLIPAATLLVLSQLRSQDALPEALRGAVAGVVAMVPEGLVLLTSVAFAVAVVRLGRRQVLVQELPAVEGLARVDVLCIDKTGTLTEGRLVLDGVELLGDERAVASDALAALAAADPSPNATLRAIAEGHPGDDPGWAVVGSVPFSSARKWSATAFDGQGTFVLGAPEVLAGQDGEGVEVLARAEALAETGRRVLLLQHAPEVPRADALPDMRLPLALVLLRDRVRDDASATMAYFAEQGVAVKVISGDSPHTVGAVAGQVGLPGAEDTMDARELPEDPVSFAEAVEGTTVFGRVTPRQKRAMVGALKANGHVVAMTGDGVNDVLALKDADIGIAMGTGSDASRAVANLVLLDSRFSAMPSVVGEGRRVLANIERTAKLFVTKTVYALLLALAVGLASFPFPFLPRHLTLVGSLTIGIPAFVLTFERSRRRAQPGFIRRVLRFAGPAGIMAAVGTFSAYAFVLEGIDVPLAEAQTTATLVLFLIGIVIVVILARPLSRTDLLMVIGVSIAFAAALLIPMLREFFGLQLPPTPVWLGASALAGAIAVVVQLAIPGPLDPDVDERRRELAGRADT